MTLFPMRRRARATSLLLTGLMGWLAATATPATAATAAADNASLSVVFVGNSITRHGPAPAVKWTGDWGMAASSAQTDYAAQTLRRLRAAGAEVKSHQAFNIAAFELNPKAVPPGAEVVNAGRASDLLVVELGDNVKATDLVDFAAAYGKLLTQARPAKGQLICLSTWWKSAATDAVIEPACGRAGGVYVAIGDIQDRPDAHPPASQGLTDPGVLRHPGDAGMAEIGARIATAWRSAQAKKR